jgi:hypothetical protein
MRYEEKADSKNALIQADKSYIAITPRSAKRHGLVSPKFPPYVVDR